MVERRDPHRPNESGQRRRADDPDFLTPREVCQRWRIDFKTLEKLRLAWVILSPRCRRIELKVIERYEQKMRLRYETSSS